MMKTNLSELIRRRQLDALVRRLPNTYWGTRFVRLQKAKELGLKVINTKDTE